MTTAKAKAAPAAEKPASAAHPSLRALERPANLTGTNAPGFGSDVVADTLRALEIPYIALNPGASYRGLHDSIVNFLGNETPQMLLCLHEESAVAIAHGYAKVTGKAMAAAVHSNVGLFHATMAIFNAWCDRSPVIVLGATGPVDAAKRRPWIDWIHTARDQGAIVRNYTKWDDQPASPAAAREALIRATWIANTAPMGPVYINLDAEMQEAKLADPLAPIDAARFMPQASPSASAELIAEAAAMLKGAKHPVIFMGRVSRSLEGWNDRIALAETLNAKVISDLKIGCGFPDRSSAARRRAGVERDGARSDRGAEGGGRHPRARLGRSRRRPARGVRPGNTDRQDHQCQRRLPHPQRLEHGLRNPARRSTCCCRRRPTRRYRSSSPRSAARARASRRR